MWAISIPGALTVNNISSSWPSIDQDTRIQVVHWKGREGRESGKRVCQDMTFRAFMLFSDHCSSTIIYSTNHYSFVNLISHCWGISINEPLSSHNCNIRSIFPFNSRFKEKTAPDLHMWRTLSLTQCISKLDPGSQGKPRNSWCVSFETECKGNTQSLLAYIYNDIRGIEHEVMSDSACIWPSDYY